MSATEEAEDYTQASTQGTEIINNICICPSSSSCVVVLEDRFVGFRRVKVPRLPSLGLGFVGLGFIGFRSWGSSDPSSVSPSELGVGDP